MGKFLFINNLIHVKDDECLLTSKYFFLLSNFNLRMRMCLTLECKFFEMRIYQRETGLT